MQGKARPYQSFMFLKRLLPQRDPLPISWSLRDVGIAALIFLGIQLLALILLRIFIHEGKPPFLFFFSLHMLASLSSSIWIVRVARHRSGMDSLGFLKTEGKAFGTSFLAYLLFLPVYFLVAAFWGMILKGLEIEFEPQRVFLELLQLDTSSFIAVFLCVIFLGPFLEELFFRSFFQPVLEKHLGNRRGLILCSILFALLHEPVAFLPVLSLGLFFGFLYQRTRRIYLPFAVHALHNGLVSTLWILIPEFRKTMGE